MTGEGMRNVYPHARFVGLLPGGIVNGIAGNAYYLWAVSNLEKA